MRNHFKFSRPVAGDSEENALPFINIVFLLLIFFLVAGAITIPDRFHVEPPVSDSKTRPPPADTIVLIAEDGRLSFQNELIEADQLHALAREMVKTNPLQPFKLKADNRASSAAVIGAMQALQNAGARQTLLITTGGG